MINGIGLMMVLVNGKQLIKKKIMLLFLSLLFISWFGLVMYCAFKDQYRIVEYSDKLFYVEVRIKLIPFAWSKDLIIRKEAWEIRHRFGVHEADMENFNILEGQITPELCQEIIIRNQIKEDSIKRVKVIDINLSLHTEGNRQEKINNLLNLIENVPIEELDLVLEELKKS